MTTAAVPDTAREFDANGWYEIQDNPVSKVGVFPYRGRMVDPNGTLGLDPDAVYQVYRSAEALSNPETLHSFKLIPWVDDHDMLGSGAGLIEADEKGIKGITGENVSFEDDTLYVNIKQFSGSHAADIDRGKDQLSLGYRCKYRMESGVWGDQHYTVVQHTIRGNHIASVDEGRMGPDVAVLDKSLTFTLDSKDFEFMAPKAKSFKHPITGLDLSDAEVIALLVVATDEKDEDKDKSKGEDADEDKEAEKAKGEDDKEDKDMKAEDEDENDKDRDMAQDEDEDKDKSKGEDASAMDARLRKLEARPVGQNFKSVVREMGRRDALYAKVSEAVGAFDHDDMTEREVATYACDKLGLEPAKGHEVTAVNAYFHARPHVAAFGPTHGADRAIGAGRKSSESNVVRGYFNGDKKTG